MNKVFFGDCRESMRQMITDGVKVQMCVTSPPYYGLRDYGDDGQLGLERTPDEFIENMVGVFKLVRDLLEDDGVLWLNIGDSYAGSGKGGNPDANNIQSGNKGSMTVGSLYGTAKTTEDNKRINVTGGTFEGIKAKDLIGIPWMLAFALRADGWYLRQDIIWSKPNPMPESVQDRCTKSHEYMFLLSKSAKYYYDIEAIKEPAVTSEGGTDGVVKDQVVIDKRDIHSTTRKGLLMNRPNSNPNGKEYRREAGLPEIDYEKRNKRSVWTITTKPYAGAHFAVFPEELIEPCILAGSKPNDIVLDPFFGSGTTGQVCETLGRQWVGCELNKEYEGLQKARTAQQGIVFE